MSYPPVPDRRFPVTVQGLVTNISQIDGQLQAIETVRLLGISESIFGLTPKLEKMVAKLKKRRDDIYANITEALFEEGKLAVRLNEFIEQSKMEKVQLLEISPLDSKALEKALKRETKTLKKRMR